MITEISREHFESVLPSMADAEGFIYEKAKPLLLDTLERFNDWHTDYNELSEAEIRNIESVLTQAVCETAAHDLMPQLDLVATPTGFGVASNQSVQPASRHRVDALREQLRMDASRHADEYLERLREYGVLAHSGMISSLFYSPTLCRENGIMTSEGTAVYAREFDEVKPRIDASESEMQMLIGSNLYVLLLSALRKPPMKNEAAYMPFNHLLAPVRRLLEAMVNKRNTRYALAIVYRTARQLAELDAEHADNYTEILNIINRQKYENRKTDPCFFFG